MGNAKSTDGKPSLADRKEKLEDLYKLANRKLGRGHYATVWQGTRISDGKQVAIKKIKKALTDERRLRAEIHVLQQAGKHKNIVELIDVFETAREVQIVTELCSGGELFDRLAEKGPYSEADCATHIRDMASAVSYLHSKNIIHRDLKPENILLSSASEADAVVKVADFGLAKIVVFSADVKTKCGTWGYSAPEMVSGSDSAFGYDCKVDSWSIGTILYILLCGFHPFDPNGTSSDNEMMGAIKACEFDFEDEAWQGVSQDARDLIKNLLVLDPSKRFSMEELLNHPWITSTAAEAVHKNDDDDDLHAAIDSIARESSTSGAATTPLSPTIHKDLARFREKAREKKEFSFSAYGEEDDDNNVTESRVEDQVAKDFEELSK